MTGDQENVVVQTCHAFSTGVRWSANPNLAKLYATRADAQWDLNRLTVVMQQALPAFFA